MKKILQLFTKKKLPIRGSAMKKMPNGTPRKAYNLAGKF